MRNVTHSFEMPSIFCLWLAKQSEAYAFVGFYLVSYSFVGWCFFLCCNFALGILLSWLPAVWVKLQSRTLVSSCGQQAEKASWRAQLTQCSSKLVSSTGSEMFSEFSPWIYPASLAFPLLVSCCFISGHCPVSWF